MGPIFSNKLLPRNLTKSQSWTILAQRDLIKGQNWSILAQRNLIKGQNWTILAQGTLHSGYDFKIPYSIVCGVLVTIIDLWNTENVVKRAPTLFFIPVQILLAYSESSSRGFYLFLFYEPLFPKGIFHFIVQASINWRLEKWKWNHMYFSWNGSIL